MKRDGKDTAATDNVVLSHLAGALHLPTSELSPDRQLRELGLDSLRSLQLLFDLESELAIELDDDAMQRILSSATVADLNQAFCDAVAVLRQ